MFRVALISWFCASTLAFSAAARDTIILNTEENYPYNYLEEGLIKGTSTEILKSVFKKAQVPYRLVLGPWVQSYSNALGQKNNCIYSAIRSAERSSLFKWIMPVEDLTMVIYKLKGNPTTASKLDDLGGKIIGGYMGDASARYLKARGFNINEALSDNLNPHRLRDGRIDLWVTSDFSGPRLSQEADIEIEPVITLYETQMGLACNKNIDDALITQLQESLEALSASGEIHAIHEQKKTMKGPNSI